MRQSVFLRCVAICLLLVALCTAVPAFSACRVPSGTTAVAANAPTGDDTLAAYLRCALMDETPTVPLDVYADLTEERIERVYSRLLATDPYLFFVTPTYTLSTRGEGGVPVSLTPTYRYRGAALQAAREDFAARVRAYLDPLPAGAAPLARVADLHDRMILDFTYDEREEVVDPYSLLVGGHGVCQAYSLLFTVLCRAAGIPAETVTCFERSHAWNQVAIGDAWYHVDLTWDETALPYPGRVPHTYLLLTDRELAARRSLDDASFAGAVWDAPHACDGGSLSSFGLWASTGRGATLDGETLYFAAEGTVYALDCRTMTRRTVYRDPDAQKGTSLSVLCPRGDEILCSLTRALLTIRPTGGAGNGTGEGSAETAGGGTTGTAGAGTAESVGGGTTESAGGGTDTGSAAEICSLSHALPAGAGVYAGLSLSPGGYPLLTTVAYID